MAPRDGDREQRRRPRRPDAAQTPSAAAGLGLCAGATPPVVLPNGDTLTGTRDGYLTRTGQDLVRQSTIFGRGTLTAAPTRLSDGRLVVVSREGMMTVGSFALPLMLNVSRLRHL